VDENDWLTCTDPDRMLAFLLSAPTTTSDAPPQRRAVARKWRLLACAFCRRIDDLLIDERSRQALEVSERFADGLASDRELREAQEEAAEAAEESLGGIAVQDSYSAGAFGVPSAGHKAKGLAARAAAEAASLRAPEEAVTTAFEAAIERGVAIGGTAWAVEALGAPAREWLLRDVFGNPFRPVEFAPDWRTENVLGIARGAYDEREFGRLPILADALQDAGCDSDELLAHCRESVFHVQGCWALDLVLGH
jgi:hypothetical protein